ncbi:HAAS signaling domain-containing protein [Nonomuraea indica]|uniref:HAAS signaling domain-containing protein n=1 Tax=Nonomuraea indica TaxID=1581193 RepID=UPI000C7BB093|nr:hypothetical protein [Nonomuraea indica]
MTPTTLTERYVHEVVRRIPADQRDDVAAELRATIADTIDARDPDGRGAAEREVLTEMGDPIRLAARYADRPLALIGPDLYPAYIRLLGVLLAAVLPVVTVISVVVDVLDGDSLGAVIGAALGTVLTVGAQFIAWLTLVFALAERFGKRRGAARGAGSWTPDQLPEAADSGSRTAAIGGLAVDALILGLIVWQHTAKPYVTDGGERLSVLDPALWTGWMWPVLAGLAGLVVLGVLRTATGRWTTPLVAAYAAANALFALPMAWILHSRQFFDSDFLADLGGLVAPDAFYTVTALGVLAVSAHDVYKRVREWRA